MDFFKPFAYDDCRECGQSLQGCPVMSLSAEAAGCRDQAAERQGRHQPGTEKGTSCFACNFICPHHCNPAQLILERWPEMYRERELPARAEYYDTNHTRTSGRMCWSGCRLRKRRWSRPGRI